LEFVRQFHRDPGFESLTEDGKVWVTEIVGGTSVWEAARVIDKMRVEKALTRLRNRGANHD
jgi:hypothetical protein